MNGLLSSTTRRCLSAKKNDDKRDRTLGSDLHNLLHFGGDLVPVLEDGEGDVLLDAVVDEVCANERTNVSKSGRVGHVRRYEG